MTPQYETRALTALSTSPTLRLVALRGGLELTIAGQNKRFLAGDEFEIDRAAAMKLMLAGAADLITEAM